MKGSRQPDEGGYQPSPEVAERLAASRAEARLIRTSRRRRRLDGERSRLEWNRRHLEEKGIPVAVLALAAGGVGVWYGSRPWPLYGWSIAWTWPFLLAVGLPFFVWAWRRRNADLEAAPGEWLAALLCLAVAGAATSLAAGARVWDAGQCWAGDTTSVQVLTVEYDHHRRSPDEYDITYLYEGERYSGTSYARVREGDVVNIVRPGGPVCDDSGGSVPYVAFLAGLSMVVGGWSGGRLVAALRLQRRAAEESPPTITAAD